MKIIYKLHRSYINGCHILVMIPCTNHGAKCIDAPITSFDGKTDCILAVLKKWLTVPCAMPAITSIVGCDQHVQAQAWRTAQSTKCLPCCGVKQAMKYLAWEHTGRSLMTSTQLKCSEIEKQVNHNICDDLQWIFCTSLHISMVNNRII